MTAVEARSEITNELIFGVLQNIQATLADHSQELREIKGRRGIIETQYASLSNRIDRIDERSACVERRLELLDA
ncbi:hypothetical protein [Acuticoccus sp.]|uniref:hypothetical protein n=1 Tax=Acuticoccus sp. TaxID=1904378 RepID=UPI003B529205